MHVGLEYFGEDNTAVASHFLTSHNPCQKWWSLLIGERALETAILNWNYGLKHVLRELLFFVCNHIGPFIFSYNAKMRIAENHVMALLSFFFDHVPL